MKYQQSYSFILIYILMMLFALSSWGQQNVIQINNILDLQRIGNAPGFPINGEYELVSDIDGSDTINWNNGEGFKPIGTESAPFVGKFNGNGYRIIGIYINRTSTNDVGLFGISSGEISNVRLERCSISGYNRVGGLVGNNSGRITGCDVGGLIEGKSRVGGITGNNSGIISGSTANIAVFGEGDDIGGLVGYNDGNSINTNNNILNCSSEGFVTGNSK